MLCGKYAEESGLIKHAKGEFYMNLSAVRNPA